MPFQLCTWLLPLNTCFACYRNRLQVVCGSVCVSAAFFTPVSVCNFFFFGASQTQTSARLKMKAGRCTYLRRERRSFPQGQMTAEPFCHLWILCCCLLIQVLVHPLPQHDLNPSLCSYPVQFFNE